MVQDDEPVGLDGVAVEFDDERVVSDAGVVLVATLARAAGDRGAGRRSGRVCGRAAGRGATRARKVMALVYAMVLGADSIDDCDVLRAGRTRRLLGGWVPAPSTLGTFLRAFTFGHVRQLDRVLGRGARARLDRRAPGRATERLVIDVDSFVGEVCGHAKQGAAYGYTRGAATTRSSPPARTRARCCTSACARARRTRRTGSLRFCDELIARVAPRRRDRRQAAPRRLGLLEQQGLRALEQAGWQYSIGVRMHQDRRERDRAIDEDAWQPIADYPDDGRGADRRDHATAAGG